ncbi:aminotransferase class V-fold PLP-dependent enzyme [Nocardia sp. NBC_00416]|uniref:aminotransferase class V-fold PLP-dependent enzyme n=1 Tax=Nocardia sp. NBC_00416 TaxID=2975991 RepID=UPI002E22C048
MVEAARLRAEIEADPNRRLGRRLIDRLRAQTTHAATVFTLSPDRTTLCPNATSGAAALIASLPLGPADTVVVLDTEYASIIRAWEIACAKTSAQLIQIPVPLPFTGTEQLLADLDDRVPGPVSYLQISLITSSAAIRLPVHELSEWVHRRGGRLILDAAHGPGHIPLTPDIWGAAAVFGTVHKWLPAQRSVGFLSLAPDLVDHVRPAEVSLTWDSGDLIERFSWPGTFDPVPRLALHTAIDQWAAWRADGLLDSCTTLAETATDLLTTTGARPTAAGDHLPPRLRAFLLDDVTVPEVKSALRLTGVRAWVGPGPAGECLLRVAVHIYNDLADLETLAGRIQEVLPR